MVALVDTKQNPKTGKGKFLKRLAEELPYHDVFVTNNPNEKHDIYLAANVFKHKTKAKKVLRVNGVYHNIVLPYKKMNETIAVQCRKADGIIYQSRFCKDMHHKYVGTYNVPTQIIFNGARTRLSALRFSNKAVGLARWRPHKRKKDIIKSSKLAQVEPVILEKIRDDKLINEILHQSLVMINISWISWCDNSIVEALAMGCPVITNNVGGNQELIKEGCGKVLHIDAPYNMRPVNLLKPPKINREILAEAIKDSTKWPRVTNNWHIDIKNIAEQYKTFFEEVLNA